MKRRFSAVGLLGVISTGLLAAQGRSEPVTILWASGRESLPVSLFAGVPMIRLDDLAPRVGATVSTDATAGTATFSVGHRSATISSGRSLVPAGEKLILLPAPASFQAGSLWVPLDFLAKVLPELSAQKVLYRADTRQLILGQGFSRLTVRTFPYPGYTRLVLEPSASVPYEVSQLEGRVLIALQTPYLETDFESEELRDGVVERLSLSKARDREGYLLEVKLGERFASLKAFELEGPHRIVLDLMRSRIPGESSASSRPASGSPADPPAAGVPPRGFLRSITLDPGHGGAETGARGPNGLLEKDVTLALARRLRSLLENELGIRVVLTRESDQIVGLDERTAVANSNKSDLFISIHTNASPRPAARGSETYYLSRDGSDEEARGVAQTENQSAVRPGAPHGDQALDFILWDMAQTAHLNESAALAELLQEELNGVQADDQNRGIKQAPFRVLMGAQMPAVLVEIGFITNPDEEERLGSSEHQGGVAQAIYRAIVRFRERYERRLGAPGDSAPQRDSP
jgi:N-acetylmuramoyl-L-alanine amidase